MATRGVTEIRENGTDYTINDPNIADEFSASESYAIGDLVYYQGDLYQFVTAHAAGSWSSSHAQKVLAGDKLKKADRVDVIEQSMIDSIALESGSYYDSDGVTKRTLNTRIRNVRPVIVTDYESIILPFGYEMWIIRLNKDQTLISAYGSWQRGKIDVVGSVTNETKYINFAIRSITAPDDNISASVAAVQSGMQYIHKGRLASETDVTNNYEVTVGQAYGTVGYEIVETSGLAYRHLKILKTDNVEKIVLSTTNTSSDVSSYIQYVDDNNIVIALDIVKGQYSIGTVYEYYPVFPEGATGMYATGGFKNAGREWDLRVFRESEISADTMNRELSEKEQIQFDRIVKSVNRIANGVGNYPRQSIVGFKAAYKIGFRAMLCDLRWTQDNIPVLEHDELLNGYYHDVYTASGELVSTDPGVYIANTDYADLLAYDFGYYKGAEYKGTRIMTFEQMLDLCKKLGCEVHIETKTELTETQYGIAFGLIRLYGMERQCVWNPQSLVQLASLIAYEPNVYINLHTNLSSGSALSDSAVDAVCDAVNDYNRGHVSLTVTLGATMTDAQAKTLSEAGVGVMGTTLNTAAQVLEYYNQGTPYTCITSVLSDGVIAGKVLLDATL